MQLLKNYCKNFCKILQENALTLTNSCKILQDMFGSCKKIARVVCFFCKIFSRVVFSLDDDFVIALKDSDTYGSKFRVLLYISVNGILQSIQKQAFRTGTENDNIDLI